MNDQDRQHWQDLDRRLGVQEASLQALATHFQSFSADVKAELRHISDKVSGSGKFNPNLMMTGLAFLGGIIVLYTQPIDASSRERDQSLLERLDRATLRLEEGISDRWTRSHHEEYEKREDKKQEVLQKLYDERFKETSRRIGRVEEALAR